MKTAFTAALAFALLLAAAPVPAQTLSASGAFARASVGPVAGAYLTLTLAGGPADRLIAAASPVCASVELHTHAMDNGVMTMKRLESIPVAPGTPAVLKPGGLHLMLIGLGAPLKEGDRVPLTLTFASGARLAVEAPVMAAGAMAAPGGDHARH